MDRYYGIYRAKVIDNRDPYKFGRVKVWIPDQMVTVNDKAGLGLWARPANNPIGGRNMEEDSAHHYSGSSYIPLKGSWIWIFYEGGNPNRPYYLSALDLENTPVLPENQLGTNYELKWTIFKSHMGRCIVISDDPDDERVEITSKKRFLTNPPTGDLDSVYQIDGNQTTILLDERGGKEKVLIRTVKGDFIHVDIDEQQLHAYFKSDIHIKTDGAFYVKSAGEMHIKTDDKLFISSAKDMNISTSMGNMFIESGMKMDIYAKMDFKIFAGFNINIKAVASATLDSGMLTQVKGCGTLIMEGKLGVSAKSSTFMNLESLVTTNILSSGTVNTDGLMRYDQMKLALPAIPATCALDADVSTPATAANPVGERDT